MSMIYTIILDTLNYLRYELSTNEDMTEKLIVINLLNKKMNK